MVIIAIGKNGLRVAWSSRRASSRQGGNSMPVVDDDVVQRRGRDGQGVIPLDEEHGRIRQGFTGFNEVINRERGTGFTWSASSPDSGNWSASRRARMRSQIATGVLWAAGEKWPSSNAGGTSSMSSSAAARAMLA
jgi:hypothetical protein